MKKIAILLLIAGSLSANSITQTCVEKDSSTYFPIGDERGVSILTKKEVNRDCNITTTVQGACTEWENKRETYKMPSVDYNTYRSTNNASALGTLFSTLGAYDQLEHLWSGWKGYCQAGTKENFDWASDPMFWAGMAMSILTSDASTTTTDPVTGATTTVANGAEGSTIQSINSNITSTQDSIISGVQSVGESAGINMTKATAKCVIAAGLDFSKDLYSRLITGSKDIPCDPVDEFCGDDEQQTKESDIMTIDRSEYEQMIADNPDIANYIVILDEQNDILTIRYKKVNEVVDTTNMDMEAMKKLQDKIANMQFIISTAMTTAKLAGCIGSNMATDGKVSLGDSASGAYANDGRLSVKNMASTGIDFIPAQLLGPYGPFIKAGMQIVLQFATSFQSIDTCHDEKDAQAAGTRDQKTQESLPYNLCHKTSEECAQKSIFGGCTLTGYNYCCYDQILTKVLIEQMKAQLGRDWAHCTGITIRDLKFVSFVQCTADDMSKGFDGAKQVGFYDPKGSFQYKQKCVDLTDFKDYLQAQIGQQIDLSDFEASFSDIKAQNK